MTEKSFPYQAPSKELTTKYSHLEDLAQIELPLLKIIFDKIFAIYVILVTTPLLLIVFLASKIEGWLDRTTKGPFLYFYWSVSGGKKIKKWKIRQTKLEFVDKELAKKNLWEAYQSEWNADAFTKVGKFVKNYYLDEIPQFWSVLRGNMTIVGPRPLALSHYARDLEQGNVTRRLVRGGILGFGHVRKGTEEFGDPGFEFEYADFLLKKSAVKVLWLDLWIIFMGIKVMLRGEGL